jgi:hypothetical protein
MKDENRMKAISILLDELWRSSSNGLWIDDQLKNPIGTFKNSLKE